MGSIPYAHTSDRTTTQDPPQERLRVRIDPQYHEMIVDPATIHNRAGQMNMPVSEALPLVMIELLRDQAIEAYNTVMRGGLTALSGRPMEAGEVESAMRHYVEEAARRVETAEAEAKQWKDLAARRAVEVNALERAIARRSDA